MMNKTQRVSIKMHSKQGATFHSLLVTFFLCIYDIQCTKENKIYNHQVHWKYMYLGEKVKVKKKIKNAINNIKKVLKS